MRNWVNWGLIIFGVVCITLEMILGAVTGFDLALIGASMAAGGVIGLFFSSTKVGLFSAAVFALVYFVFFRRMIRNKLTVAEKPTNVDAIIGHTGVVTVRIDQHTPGQVKVGSEIWRAELAPNSPPVREPGDTVTVQAVEGVTLKVR